MSKINKRKILILVIFGIIILSVIAFVLSLNNTSSDLDVEAGLEYLKTQEGKNPQLVYDVLSARQKRLEEELKTKKQEERFAEIDKALESGDGSIWNLFVNTAILGDSRVEGFKFFSFLDSQYVFSNGGDTIRNIKDWESELVKLNPKHIVLSYGINDVGIGYWSSGEEYAQEFKQILDGLQKVLPESKFYVSSILEAIDPAFDRSPIWREIPTYNEALKKMLEGTEYTYIDNSEIIKKHINLYDADGVHFHYEFYQYWASNILKSLVY